MIGLLTRGRLAAALLALSVALAGCESFDPEKVTDIFGTTKKKLPGERKAVFPEGVPGVPQGVPPDLIKGNQPPPDANPPAVVTANPSSAADAKQAAEQPNPHKELQAKPKPKPKPKKSAQQAQPADQAQPGQSQPAPQAAPWPTPQPQAAPSPWPSPSR